MKRRGSSTDVRKTMRPGEPGTRRHLRDWGDRLVCVRHRVDPVKGLRFTTIEIVASAKRVARLKREPHPEALVYARVGRDEWELESRLRTTRSATYDEALNVWRMRYETAVRLRLKRRILFKRPEKRHGFAPRNHSPNSNIPAHQNPNIPSHPRPKSREFE
jgi:hypothetical protein